MTNAKLITQFTIWTLSDSLYENDCPVPKTWNGSWGFADLLQNGMATSVHIFQFAANGCMNKAQWI